MRDFEIRGVTAAEDQASELALFPLMQYHVIEFALLWAMSKNALFSGKKSSDPLTAHVAQRLFSGLTSRA